MDVGPRQQHRRLSSPGRPTTRDPAEADQATGRWDRRTSTRNALDLRDDLPRIFLGTRLDLRRDLVHEPFKVRLKKHPDTPLTDVLELTAGVAIAGCGSAVKHIAEHEIGYTQINTTPTLGASDVAVMAHSLRTLVSSWAAPGSCCWPSRATHPQPSPRSIARSSR